MKLKNPLSFGSYAFYIGEGEDTIRIPSAGFSNSKNRVVDGIISMFDALAAQGEPGYKDRATEEASRLSIPYTKYIGLLLEHQICIRAGGMKSGICQGSGLGDTLHSFSGKVDDTIEKAPDFIKKPLQKLISSTVLRKETGDIRRTGRVSGCSGCGGTRTFTKAAWNFGRVGRLNKKD